MSNSNLGERPHSFDAELVEPDILYTIEQYVPLRTTAQHGLAIALIDNAVRDLRGKDTVNAADALDWLQGRVTDGVTFQACCDSLGVEPEVILERLDAVRKRATGYRSWQ